VKFSRKSAFIATSLAFGLGSSCSSLPKNLGTAQDLFEATCSGPQAPGKSVTKVSGSIWAKVESPELKGQFPATVLAQAPNKLALEVTNLIGSPQAWLKMEDGHVNLKLTPATQRAYGQQSIRSIWGGLPLEFAPDLFLGRVPCPRTGTGRDLRISVVGERLEVIETDLATKARSKYLYSYRGYDGRPWPKALTFQGVLKSGQAIRVDFEFESPSGAGAIAERWSATSTRGTAKVRWKDRAVEP